MYIQSYTSNCNQVRYLEAQSNLCESTPSTIFLMLPPCRNKYIAVSFFKYIVSVWSEFNIHRILERNGNGEHRFWTGPQRDKLSLFMMGLYVTTQQNCNTERSDTKCFPRQHLMKCHYWALLNLKGGKMTFAEINFTALIKRSLWETSLPNCLWLKFILFCEFGAASASALLQAQLT